MIQFITSKGEYILVKVPNGSYNFVITEENTLWCHYPSGWTIDGLQGIGLPQESYTFLCTTDDISEEVAKKIVPKECPDGYDVYYNYIIEHYCYLNPIRAVQSLLQSLNLSLDKNYAIFQKKINKKL